jgi:hypothetical protein
VHLAGSGSTMFVEGHLATVDGTRWDMTGPEGPLQLSTLTTTPAARRELFTGGATLKAGSLQHLLVLLLAHALTALLD